MMITKMTYIDQKIASKLGTTIDVMIFMGVYLKKELEQYFRFNAYQKRVKNRRWRRRMSWDSRGLKMGHRPGMAKASGR